MNLNMHRCTPAFAAQMFVVITVILCGATTEAAPMSFRFTATVQSVSVYSAAIDLPFTLFAGKEFSGTYIFASVHDLFDVVVHPELGKTGTLALSIDGVEFSGAVNTGSNTGAVFPPFSPGGPDPFSVIRLGYLSPTDMSSAGMIAGLPWNHQLMLVGLPGTLAEPTSDEFVDLATWNQLTIADYLPFSLEIRTLR